MDEPANALVSGLYRKLQSRFGVNLVTQRCLLQIIDYGWNVSRQVTNYLHLPKCFLLNARIADIA
jgi:hypothetical protein